MKAKPVLIIFGVLVVLTCAFLFFRGRNVSMPQKNDVYIFLTDFNNHVKAGNPENLVTYFKVNQKTDILNRLLNVLTNRTGFKGDLSPLFNLTLDIEKSNIRILNSELAEATIPVSFTNDTVPAKTSVLKLKIHQTSPHEYEIVQIDATKLMIDYLAYNNLVKGKTLTDKDIYSPATLTAFETAKQLKTQYDSVIWFAHMGQKTFFYVVKGKWDMDADINRYKDSVIAPYTMGLLGPDLKQIIPPQYDLIHNISATFLNLVEVEKAGKRGFYDLDGKIVIPVNYDQVFPIDDDDNLAVLRNGSDYFYLKKDMTISDKADIKIGDFFPKIRKIGNSFNLYTNALAIITEYNSRENHGAIYVTPSYLADLNIIGKEQDFKNPLRKVMYEDVHTNYNVGFTNEVKDDNSNWLTASFYSIRDYFLGGRSEFYEHKNIVIVDKKNNRLLAKDIMTDYSPDGGGSLDGLCNISSIKVLNDSLFEVKAGAVMYAELYDSTKMMEGGVYYHYLAVKNNQLVELPDNRNFGFTKYVKMDDSYLNGCYNMVVGSGPYDSRKKQVVSHLTPELLRYMKNEIYADYAYKFKDKRWQTVFEEMRSYNRYDPETSKETGLNASVEDSLTDIDKYNINWITQKLNAAKTKTNTLASK